MTRRVIRGRCINWTFSIYRGVKASVRKVWNNLKCLKRCAFQCMKSPKDRVLWRARKSEIRLKSEFSHPWIYCTYNISEVNVDHSSVLPSDWLQTSNVTHLHGGCTIDKLEQPVSPMSCNKIKRETLQPLYHMSNACIYMYMYTCSFNKQLSQCIQINGCFFC